MGSILRSYKALPASFYNRSPELVAPDLLGKLLVRTLEDGELLVGRITEVEAYLPFDDLASHGSWRRTPIRESLYKRGGHAYVYALRHHFLFNTVTEGKDRPGGVLIRGIEPVFGTARMEQFRDRSAGTHFTNGPGKVTQAFGITTALDGTDLTKKSSSVFVADDGYRVDPKAVQRTVRIGITKAVDKLLRFYF